MKIGDKFGELTIIGYCEPSKDKHIRLLCKCSCGNEQIVYKTRLKNGVVTKCKECSYKNMNKTHGLTGTKGYNLWLQIKQRCYYKKNKSYKDYGGRGIKMCDEWLNNPIEFCKWYEENNPNGLSIDRIDPNRNYEPANCRFIALKEQAENKRKTIYIEHNGVTKTSSQWAKEIGISTAAMWQRYKRHKNDERIFEKQWRDDRCKNQYTDSILNKEAVLGNNAVKEN